MRKLQGVMGSFGVYPETCMSLSIATDGLKEDANILMLALTGIDDTDISVFIAGGDVVATQKFTGITPQVYESLAVEPEIAAEVFQSKLRDLGITTLVSHQTDRFVRPRLLRLGLVRNSMSFVDVGYLNKALRFWTEHLTESSNLIDLHERTAKMRGKNVVKLDTLADEYDANRPEDAQSPYVPVNKSRQVWDIFTKQLETELPF